MNQHAKITDVFVDQATTFLNQINAHPDDLKDYGVGLWHLGSTLNTYGIQIVVSHHFIISSKTLNGKLALIYSSIPYHIHTRKKADGKLGVSVSLSPDEKKRTVLGVPNLNDIQECFYDLLLIAIIGNWSNDTITYIPANQVRFLLRLDGYKCDDALEIINDLKRFVKDADTFSNQSGKVAQKICMKLLQILGKHKTNTTFFQIVNVVQEEAFYDPHLAVPFLLSPSEYEEHLKRNTDLSENQVADKIAMAQTKVPSDDTIMAMDRNFNGMEVTTNDLVKFAKAVIYFLK